eukprot:Nk52_evm23s2192 gene=Nk52_evmTU23s2192
MAGVLVTNKAKVGPGPEPGGESLNTAAGSSDGVGAHVTARELSKEEDENEGDQESLGRSFEYSEGILSDSDQEVLDTGGGGVGVEGEGGMEGEGVGYRRGSTEEERVAEVFQSAYRRASEAMTEGTSLCIGGGRKSSVPKRMSQGGVDELTNGNDKEMSMVIESENGQDEEDTLDLEVEEVQGEKEKDEEGEERGLPYEKLDHTSCGNLEKRGLEEINEEIIYNYSCGIPKTVFDDVAEEMDELYKRIDKYGFILSPEECKKRLSRPKTKADKKYELKQNQRSLKWNEMLHDWELYSGKKYDTLLSRTFKGVPDGVRTLAWAKFLNVGAITVKGHYEALKERIKESPDLHQIDIDINRTYRDHIMYRSRYGVRQQALFWVLSAYSLHNKEVGYCQSMSSICGNLLMYMEEEPCFWALHHMLSGNGFKMSGLYAPGLPKLQKMFEEHSELLKAYLPDIFKCLEDNDIMVSSYASKWYMQVFQDKLPFNLQLRIWDVFLLKGYTVVHATALLIFKMNRKKMLKMDFEELTVYLRDMHNLEFDCDRFMNGLKPVLKWVEKRSNKEQE